jgi:hypothetical protein
MAKAADRYTTPQTPKLDTPQELRAASRCKIKSNYQIHSELETHTCMRPFVYIKPITSMILSSPPSHNDISRAAERQAATWQKSDKPLHYSVHNTEH